MTATATVAVPSRPPAAERGSTTYSRRAVQRLASAVLAEVPRASALDDPDVQGKLAVGQTVQLDLLIGVRADQPLRATLDEVSRRLIERFGHLAGMKVDQVRLRIARLEGPASPAKKPA